MRWMVIFGAIWSAALVLPAKAEFSGAKLYNLCASNERVADIACEMWVTAFGGALFYAQTITLRQKGHPLTCMPDGVSGVQFKLIIEKYLHDHPTILQLDAVSLAAAALITAFPCKNSN